MFHVSFLIRDKHLAEVLHSLESKAMNLEVQPTKHSENKPEAQPRTKASSSAISTILQDLVLANTPFRVENVATLAHCSLSAASNAIRELAASGVIQGTKVPGSRGFTYRKANADGLETL